MSHQEFNNIYYLFTKDKKGIRPQDTINTTGYELKEFIEFALERILHEADRSQTELFV